MIKSYSELTTGQYIQICDILKNEDESKKDLAILSILSGKTADELLDMPLTEYLAIKQDASFLFDAPEIGKARQTYVIGRTVYRIPKDFKRLTAGQYLDFQEVNGDLVSLLSVLLVPEGKEYGKGYDIASLQDDIRDHLPATDALALNAFFLRLSQQLIRDTITSSAREIRRSKMSKEEKKNLLALLSLADGDGHGACNVVPKSATLLWQRYAMNQLADF